MFSRYFLSKITMILSLFIVGSCDEYEVVEGADFNPDIAGIFLGECSQCHANGKSENGFGVVDNVPAMIAQGYIVPGSPETSKVVNRIKGENIPENAYRMPLRGPFLSDEKINSIENWVKFDLPGSSSGESHKVTISLGSEIKIEGSEEDTIVKTVKDGEKLSITIVAPADVSKLIFDSSSCKDPRTSLNGNVFTTGRITSDCAISITQPGEAKKPTVTAISLYGTKAGQTPGVTLTESSITIENGSTATFTFTVREGDTIDASDLSKSIESDCELGSIVEIDAATRQYSYETGKVTETCEVKIKTNTPCPTVPSGPTEFTEVRTILSSGSNCLGCHYPSNSYDLPEFDGTTQNGTFEKNHLINNNLVKPNDPWNSELSKRLEGRKTQMPDGGPYKSIEEQTKVCKWILDGAQ